MERSPKKTTRAQASRERTRVLTGVQRDWDTQKWFFIIYDDNRKVENESEPLYDGEDEAESAAEEWVQRHKISR